MLPTAAAFADGIDGDAAVRSLAVNEEAALSPEMDIAEVMHRFDAAQADELAVLDSDRTVVGRLSESFVSRRYAEELDKAQRELFGEA